jgi:glycine hydroxymethyltransferase
MIIAGFSAYSGIMDWARFREIADKIGAYLLVDMAHVSGLVAAGVYPSPIPHAHVVTSTTHKTLRGPRGGFVLTNDEAIAKKVNSAVFPGSQGGPLCHVIAAKAIAFKEAASDEFVEYQKQVVANAKAMAKTFIERGIKVVSNGTENHLMLVDLIGKEYTGTDADRAMGEAFITVNKNAVPNDPRSPFVTSGLRVGTPAITTRGFGVEESVQLTHWMCDILDGLEQGNSEQIIAEVKAKVIDICQRFPVYN